MLEVTPSAHPCPLTRGMHPVRGRIDYLHHMATRDLAVLLSDLDEDCFSGEGPADENCLPVNMRHDVTTMRDGTHGHLRHCEPFTQAGPRISDSRDVAMCRSVCARACVYGSHVHIVILGCGRVGSSLAHSLDDLGHSVSIIDMDTKAFRKLSQDFRGQTVTGVGFDRQTLETAGIERAAAFAAVSSGDNSNILGARVARETYGVASVVARIYDPRRAEIYQRLGIPTVATVAWTSGQILRGLLPMGSLEEYRDPSGTMVLSQIHVHDSWLGTRAITLEAAAGARIAFITRYGSAFLPTPETVLQDGDLIHVLYPTGTGDRVTAVFEGGVTA